MTVDQIHHGSAWWDPELVGIVRVNDDYTWVTQHLLGSDDGTDDHTASFYMTYYSDVPDDVATANVRMTGWSVNPERGDDNLVDASLAYQVNSWIPQQDFWNGNSWISFDVSTVGLGKAKTLLVTDGQVTITSAAGLTLQGGLTGVCGLLGC